jgi:hypothetical protein
LAIFSIAEKVTACFLIHLSPEDNFIDGTKASQTDIVIIQAAISDAG